MKIKQNYIVGSNNIFADLGLSNPEEHLAKAELARQINELIKKKKLTQSAAATLLDIDQPKISALSRGRLAGFSLERLFRFLNVLGQDITITITPKARSKKQANVTVGAARIKKQTTLIKPTKKDYAPLSLQAKKKK